MIGLFLRSVGYNSKPFKRVTVLHARGSEQMFQPSVYILLNMQCFNHVMFLKSIFVYVRDRKLCIRSVPQCHVAGGVWCL